MSDGMDPSWNDMYGRRGSEEIEVERLDRPGNRANGTRSAAPATPEPARSGEEETDQDSMLDGTPLHVPGFECWCEPTREWLEGGGRINYHRAGLNELGWRPLVIASDPSPDLRDLVIEVARVVCDPFVKDYGSIALAETPGEPRE